MTSAYAVDVVIEMHNADAFHDEVDAYPAITVIRSQKQGGAVVASAGPEVEHVSPKTLSAALEAAKNSKPMVVAEGLRVARVENWFHGADPWPCHSPEQLALLRRLEERFPALEDLVVQETCCNLSPLMHTVLTCTWCSLTELRG